ncbi:MAG: hypothetical protein HN768_00580 [Rhodospirillaceae bacterium]|nr:hypothetical protein [Rhodospirillaceae bacterium]
MQRFGLPAIVIAGLLASTAPAWAQSAGGPIDVDGDVDLRCAVSRAVERSSVETLGRVIESVGVAATFDSLARGSIDGTNADHITLLSNLGLVSRDGSAFTSTGQALSDLRGHAGGQTSASIALESSTSLAHAIDIPGTNARFSHTAADTGIVRIQVIPTGSASEGCGAGFDPVVRASIAGAGGLEHVARGIGSDRTAVLYLYDVPVGAEVDIAVNDVVGAPGGFDIRIDAVSQQIPSIDGTEPFVGVGDGGLAYRPITLERGQSAEVNMSISYEAWEPAVAVVGLNGAQPGVRVYESDGFGGVYGDAIFESSYLPTPDARVDLTEYFYGGEYIMVVEDLQRQAGTFIIEYTSDGFAGGGPRVYADLYLNEETVQQLGSDLSFWVEEPGWYYFETSSYDDVDPIMSLLDGDGWFLYESDDAAFSLHPLIVAELEPGAYTLTLDGFDGGYGEVLLSAYQIEPIQASLGTIGLSQSISEDYSQPPANVYIIDAPEGSLVDIDVDTSNSGFDSTLALYDTWDMTVWTSDDDGSAGYGSRLVDTFEGSQLVAVIAGYDGARGGEYSLTIVDHAKVEGLPETATVIAADGMPATGSLMMDGDIAWFRMPMLAEGWYDIEVTSNGLPYLRADLYRYEPGFGYYWYDGYEGYDGEVFLTTDGDAMSDVLLLVRNTGEEGGNFEVTVR